MQETQKIFLPAGFKQFKILKSKFIISEKRVLVIGAGSEKIAEKIIGSGAVSVKMIVNDFDSLMNSRLNLGKESRIVLEMMEYDNTDFNNNEFDLVYAQGSISSSNRSRIIKEIKSFYETVAVELKANIHNLSGQEKSYYKKLLNKISHESNAYLKLGADKYIGFKMLMLKSCYE